MATETLEIRKTNLISKIKKIADETALSEVENTVEIVENRSNEKQLEMLKKLAKPMRKTLDIDELIKEQNWRPIDREEFDRLIKEIDVQEPLEQLLADLRK